jgi:hypothetical protein
MKEVIMSQNQTPLFVKTYDFYKQYYSYSINFPKSSKEVLGKRIETLALEVLELVCLAEYDEINSKLKKLNKISNNIDLLKVLIRLLYETKSSTKKKYILLEGNLQEMGRMTGGWIKDIKNKNPE